MTTSADAFRGTVQASSYGEATIVATDKGPKFEGPVPDRIGVHAHLLAGMGPEIGEYRFAGGYLRLLDLEFRQIGWDGPDIHVFERVHPSDEHKPAHAGGPKSRGDQG